jgi:hypothetical protein
MLSQTQWRHQTNAAFALVFALYVLAGAAVLTQAACFHAPPTLGPVAATDFQKTRVIKALDLLRDFAVDGEAASPQVVPTALARKIVTYHQTTLKVLNEAGTGWQHFVTSTLDTFVQTLSAKEQSRVAPYVTLVKTLITDIGGA